MAATKNIARQVIASLADNVITDDVIQALYVREKFERGRRQVRGRAQHTPPEHLKWQMQKWAG